MKAKFITKDPQEAKRLAKADDMASCLWELQNNFKFHFTNSRETDEIVFIYKYIKESVGDINELWE